MSAKRCDLSRRDGELRRQCEPSGRRSALLLLARFRLEGPSDSGRSSYQIAITVCEACGRGFQQSHGDHFELGRDCSRDGRVDAQTSEPPARRTVAPTGRRSGESPEGSPKFARKSASHADRAACRVRRTVLRRDGGRCKVPRLNPRCDRGRPHLELAFEGGGTIRSALVLCQRTIVLFIGESSWPR